MKEIHPDLFEKAKEYEERSVEYGGQFYWCQDEPLAALERPERMEQIRTRSEAAEARARGRRKNVALVETLGGFEFEDDPALRDGCLICSL